MSKIQASRVFTGLLFFVAVFSFSKPAFALNPATGPGTEQQRFQAQEKIKQTKRQLETAVEKTAIQTPAEPVKISSEQTEEIPFLIDRIVVFGNTVISDKEIRALTESSEHKQLKLSEVKTLAGKISDLYRSKGYFTSRAFIPPQKLDTHTLEIQVLEGKLAQVNTQGNQYFKKESIEHFVNHLRGKVLSYTALKKDLTRMNLHPDREVRAVVAPGQEVGTSDLVLDVKDSFPLHVNFEANNFGTKLTGLERYTVSLRHSNLLGLDDTLGVRYQYGSRVNALGIQYALPMGPFDTLLGATFNYTDVSIGGDFTILDIAGTAYAYSVYFNQPLGGNDWLDFTWTGSAESKSIENTILSSPSSKDELRMLHTGFNVDETDRYGRSFVVNDFVFGVPWMNASDKNDPRLSRAGSGAGFFKYDGTFNRVHPIHDSTNLYLRASAQFTHDPLVSAEQYELGGAYSVRGYPQSDYMGDAGAGGSAELRVPFYFIPRSFNVPGTKEPLWNRLNFVAFLDGAYAKLLHPAAGEDKSKTYMGAGGGLRFDLPRNLTGRFEWAAPVGNAPTDRSNSHFYFTVSGDLI